MRHPIKRARFAPQRLLCLVALSAACADATSDASSGLRGALAVDHEQPENDANEDGAAHRASEADTDTALDDLDCSRGGSTAAIAVTFDCDEITVVSCKDLSNVVLEFGDGSRERFEGLQGHQATFAGTGANEGAGIVGVWVKAGANHSGDGPGYGQRFVAAEDTCAPGDTGTPPGDDEPPSDPPSDDAPPPDDGDGPIVVV